MGEGRGVDVLAGLDEIDGEDGWRGWAEGGRQG